MLPLESLAALYKQVAQDDKAEQEALDWIEVDVDEGLPDETRDIEDDVRLQLDL